MDEFALIRKLLGTGVVSPQTDGTAVEVSGAGHVGHGCAGETVIVGPGDDGAVVRPSPGKDWVVTCDAMVEGPHFTRQTMTPHAIGWKVMAANLSDIAAMAAEPRYALVTLGTGGNWTADELADLYAGMRALADRFGVKLIGGDTVRSPGGLMISVTLLGEVEPGRTWLRSGARAGDWVFVTGPLGGSAAGLEALLNPALLEHWERSGGALQRDRGKLLRLHQYPEPQIDAGRILAACPVRGSLNDVSDGLASEAWEIAEASRVKITLDAADIPVDDVVRDFADYCRKDPIHWALTGGEDFQLVGTIPANQWAGLVEAFRRQGLAVYRCGQVDDGTNGIGVFLRRPDGRVEPVAKSGYNHFANTD